MIVEVGPRDGLQNEPNHVPTLVKVAFIDALADAGLAVVEATSFVNPTLVPQLADAAEVMTAISRKPGVIYPVLVPNQRGLERALHAGVDAIALFTAATDEFSNANVAASIDGTFERFAPVVAAAREWGMWIRGYVSVAFGCPYAGSVPPSNVANVVSKLLALDCHEICLADTIGVGTPEQVAEVLSTIDSDIPVSRLALHFHDTGGLALANVAAGLERGVRTFDAAAGGLGGCPFAPGAPGNLATEALLHRLHALGLRTGVQPDGLAKATSLLQPYIARLRPAPL